MENLVTFLHIISSYNTATGNKPYVYIKIVLEEREPITLEAGYILN